MLEKFNPLQGAEFSRDLLHSNTKEVFRMMKHEVTPKNTHHGCSLFSDTEVGVNAVRQKVFVASRPKFMNSNWVILAVGVLKKILSPLCRLFPLLKCIQPKIEMVVHHRRLSDALPKIVKDS
jgi:hypothetical protein